MTLHDYCSKSGKDLILDYVNSLPEDEKTDGLSVMECMEKGEFDKIRFKRWEKTDEKLVRKRASELGKQLGKTFI